MPNSDSPLTFEEMGCVMEFWKRKFFEQALTKEQAYQDSLGKYTKNQLRHRMRGRWYTYQSRALGNRILGMALVTWGFNVVLHALAIAYAVATADGDASSLPPCGLRQRALKMRSWYRWGRQLHNIVKSEEVTWESLGPSAKNAW